MAWTSTVRISVATTGSSDAEDVTGLVLRQMDVPVRTTRTEAADSAGEELIETVVEMDPAGLPAIYPATAGVGARYIVRNLPDVLWRVYGQGDSRARYVWPDPDGKRHHDDFPVHPAVRSIVVEATVGGEDRSGRR